MTHEPDNEDNPVGLTRFHCITIGAGALLCVAFAVRMFLTYRRLGGASSLIQAIAAALLGAGLFAYLRRFVRRGL